VIDRGDRVSGTEAADVATATLSALRSAVGHEFVLTAAADRLAFERPWRGPAGRALAVVRPGDVEELRAVVRIAVDHRLPIVLQGANTGLVGAGVADPSGRQLIVSLTRIARIRDLDVADRTVIVEAGCDLDELNRVLHVHDLELPIDLGASPSIGGMIATNTGGARMVRHGDVRRRALGVEVVMVDEDATLLSDLNALRKDNGRLHLRDLVIGGDGRRGIVTAAALEVELRPAVRTTALLVPRDIDSVLTILDVLERTSGAALTAFEVVSGMAIGWVREALPHVTDPFPAGPPSLSVLVELSDRDESHDLEALLIATLDGLAQTGCVLEAFLVPVTTAWSLRHSLSEAAAVVASLHHRRLAALDVAVRRSRLPALIAALEDALSDLAADIELGHFGHWGDGGAHLLLSLPEGTSAEEVAAVRRGLYALVSSAGGSFSAEHGVGPHNLDAYDELVPAWQRQLEGAIQRLFDPHGLLGHASAGPTT